MPYRTLDALPAKAVPGRNALRSISGPKAGEDHARSQCPLRGNSLVFRDRLHYLQFGNIDIRQSERSAVNGSPLSEKSGKSGRTESEIVGSSVSQDRDPVYRPLKGDPKQEPKQELFRAGSTG